MGWIIGMIVMAARAHSLLAPGAFLFGVALGPIRAYDKLSLSKTRASGPALDSPFSC
jgi:hypothetical protein